MVNGNCAVSTGAIQVVSDVLKQVLDNFYECNHDILHRLVEDISRKYATLSTLSQLVPRFGGPSEIFLDD
jgi:hypothetical protein